MVELRPVSLDRVEHRGSQIFVRVACKRLALGLAWILVSPLVILTWTEERLFGRDCGRIFSACKEFLALGPGLLGQYTRGAFYWSTCDGVSADACFAFGSMVAQRDVVIGAGSVIGAYSIVGRAELGRNVLVAARVSIFSDRYLHGSPADRIHGHARTHIAERIRIGSGTWIGENAVVMASVGARCTISAGAVVVRATPDDATFMGNPARRVDL